MFVADELEIHICVSAVDTTSDFACISAPCCMLEAFTFSGAMLQQMSVTDAGGSMRIRLGGK